MAALIVLGATAQAGQRRSTHRHTRPRTTRSTAAQIRVATEMQTFRSPMGWRIDYPASWHVYDMTPGRGRNKLFFFAPADDSLERIAVAIVPTTATTADNLMNDVSLDAPSQYDVYRQLGRGLTRQAGLPAAWLSFRAAANGMPDLVRSYVVTVVRGGSGYAIGLRTAMRRYDERSPELLRCVRSFAFTGPPDVGRR